LTPVQPNELSGANGAEQYPSRKHPSRTGPRGGRSKFFRTPFGRAPLSKTQSVATASGVPPTAVEISTAIVPAAFAAPATPAKPKPSRKSSALSIAVTAFVIPGLFATVALPAYAYTPASEIGGEAASVTLEEFKASDAQTVFVATGAEAPAVAREAFGATTHAELERARLAAQYKAYSGPSTSDFLQNPSYPSFSLDAVYSVGLQYLGTPYRYGGSNPSGFDCSGFTQFVYAQFGVSLPHSVSGQAAKGTRISRADARPGDLVIMSGHNGFYAGNGNIMDSPRPGKVISVRPIWTEDYYIVRIGI
jgi:cell wall-associated NlpC family hydrolase